MYNRVRKLSQQQINEAVEGFKQLRQYCQPEINTNNIDLAKAIIRSFSQWNDYNPDTVAMTLQMIYEALPKIYYNEGNPNNGNYIFEIITIHSGSLITLAPSLGYNLTDEDRESVNEIIHRYGRLMKADEISLEEQHNDYMSDSLQIRFWWD